MSQHPQYSEAELVALLKRGEREGFNYLYANFSAALYGVILKITANEGTARDVLQESFVKIWTHIDQYDSGKGRLYTWMLNISRNAAIDKLRSKGEIMHGKIRGNNETVYTENQSQRTEIPIESIGLRAMLSCLKKDYEVIVELAYYQGYTLDEISKTLNIPLGTVKTRMRAAMQELRQKFKN